MSSRAIERIDDSLRNLSATAGTSLYDAVYLAGPRLQGREGRHVMVIVSDGGDTTSITNITTRWKPRRTPTRSFIRLWWCRFRTTRAATWAASTRWCIRPNHRRTHVLSHVASRTRRFGDILLDLRTQYLIGYYPRVCRRAKLFHHCSRRVDRKDLRVSTRTATMEISSARRI